MADDGMLLNFSIPDSGILHKPKFKGGAWRDRLTAKKAASNWHTRATERLTGDLRDLPISRKATDSNRTQLGDRSKPATPPPEFAIERPTKRPRTKVSEAYPAGSPDSTTSFRPQNIANNVKKQGERSDVAKGGRQIISSLFTFNPSPTTQALPKQNVQDEVPLEPSNAPLTGELDTFTSLGVSSTLAAHLFRKMELKAPTAIQKAAISQLLKDDSDAFIQAETGSGKTLAYLLPIVQRLMELSANMKKRKVDEAVQRDSGLFAIILAPTRELSKQIAQVLESLLRCAHWLVATTVIGGEKKKSEKARLRKGINILVATPGRLADHLEHTKVLDVSNVRWLVLDEGDRLMELGFEEEIQKIVSTLNLRMRARPDAAATIPGLPSKRTTVLCSATMKMDVERLGQISLKDAIHVRPDPADKEAGSGVETDDQGFFAPAQLKQSYAIVAPKLRLVSLLSFLKRAFARKGSVMKAIVFISCADSVDFHFDLTINDLDGNSETSQSVDTVDSEQVPDRKNDAVLQSEPTKLAVTFAESPFLSNISNTVTAYRLHGSLPQASRTSTLAHFAKNKEASVLFATDVASRGLDLPNVDLVVEFDPAFAREDHLHRIGRTARAGRDGRACIFLMPGCEEGYLSILKSDRKNDEGGVHIVRQDADEILKRGLVTSGVQSKETRTAFMDKATDLQLNIERWALASPPRLEAARRAFQSHIRAYATHVAAERTYFDIKQLHLGHLAKAFALRERPSGMKVPGLRSGAGREDKRSAKVRGAAGLEKKAEGGDRAAQILLERDDTEDAAKMRKAVRDKEKFMRRAGMADEFNIG